MINRDEYLNKLIGYKNEPIIKVVTGIRRCGKSTLLKMFQDYLCENKVKKEQIISINFEDMTYSDINDAKKLHDFITSKLIPDEMNYIFLDEIQNVSEFQKAVDSLYIKNNTDIYITGSNAYLLSGELATLLSGRYIEISMLPLSFKEYLAYTGDKTDIGRKFSDYLRYSSFPYTLHLKNDAEKVRDYLSGIYNTVILKDVMARRNISNSMMLESVVNFIFDNIGNLLSTNKISNTMTSNGRTISTHTVENYISALIDSFILYKAKRFDIKGREYLKTNDKYYICDIGLRNFLLGYKGDDTGHILENIVYLELIRRGYNVYVGKIGEKEVDFVAQKGDITIYYQVADTVRGEETLNRELSSLKAIPDNNPKFILTRDDNPPINHNGIYQLNVLDFLTE
jgi:predicted AAA+ superfamily ATPase